MQVIGFTLENGVFFDVQDHIQISARTTEVSRFTEPGITNTGAIFNPSWYFGLNHAFLQEAAFAFAFCARIRNDGARALTGRTGARDTEESLLITHLAAAGTSTARAGRLAGSRP